MMLKKNFVSNLALFQIQAEVLSSLKDPILLKHVNDTFKRAVVSPLENTTSSCASGVVSCSFLNTYDNLVIVSNYYKLQKGKLEPLNPYLYIAVGKKINPFSGKCNEYEEKKQMKL